MGIGTFEGVCITKKWTKDLDIEIQYLECSLARNRSSPKFLAVLKLVNWVPMHDSLQHSFADILWLGGILSHNYSGSKDQSQARQYSVHPRLWLLSSCFWQWGLGFSEISQPKYMHLIGCPPFSNIWWQCLGGVIWHLLLSHLSERLLIWKLLFPSKLLGECQVWGVSDMSVLRFTFEVLLRSTTVEALSLRIELFTISVLLNFLSSFSLSLLQSPIASSPHTQLSHNS